MFKKSLLFILQINGFLSLHLGSKYNYNYTKYNSRIYLDDVADDVTDANSNDNSAFPYQVSIRYRNRGHGSLSVETPSLQPQNYSTAIFMDPPLVTFGHVCGGSIIADRWVLTAAHCIIRKDPANIYVAARLNLLTDKSYEVEKLVRHEEYAYPDNDIAMIKLSQPVQLGQFLKQVDLPTEDTPGRVKASVSGWDWITFHMPRPFNIPQRIGMVTVSYQLCMDYFKNKQIKHINIQTRPRSKFICVAVKKELDTCYVRKNLGVDIGGPLVSKGKQIGIVLGIVPCQKGKPELYTRVYRYLNWINAFLENE